MDDIKEIWQFSTEEIKQADTTTYSNADKITEVSYSQQDERSNVFVQ